MFTLDITGSVEYLGFRCIQRGTYLLFADLFSKRVRLMCLLCATFRFEKFRSPETVFSLLTSRTNLSLVTPVECFLDVDI